MKGKAEYAIEAEGLGKRYRFYAQPHRRVFEFLSGGLWRGHRELWALRELDLAVKSGTVLGICGQNGAGKSTLLKMLSGTSSPTEGRYRVSGRVNGLLDLGAGLQLDATGRENILFQGLWLGWPRATMRRKADEIIEFAQLEEFIDEPLRTYSSGMAMRLAFSVAALMDPDVLILDEIFAVGDIAFQKRCVDRIREFKTQNKTIVFCSHSMYDMRQLCDDAIWLRSGRLASSGDVVSVTGDYMTFMRESKDVPQLPAWPVAEPDTAKEELPRVVDAHVHRPGGEEPVAEITTGDSIEIHVTWENPRSGTHVLNLGVGLIREDGVVCFGVASHLDEIRLDGSSGKAVLRLPELQVLSGRYLVPVWLLDETGSHRYHEYILDERLTINATTSQMGVFVPEHEWLIEGDSTTPQ